jgi:hypothetical protein
VQDDLPELHLDADDAELAAAAAAAAGPGKRKGASASKAGKQQGADAVGEQPWEDIAARDSSSAAAGPGLSEDDEDELLDFDDAEFEQLAQQFQQQQGGLGGARDPGEAAGAAAGGSEGDLMGEYLFAGDAEQPFDPEKGGYIRPRAGGGLQGGLRSDFDMFDLDFDFDAGMDDFFDSMGDPFGGGFMADFGGPGEPDTPIRICSVVGASVRASVARCGSESDTLVCVINAALLANY